MGGRAQPPNQKGLKKGPLHGLRPSPTCLPGPAAHSSEGRGVTDTFMIEKQLEWRRERRTIIWAKSVGRGRWGLGGPLGPNPEVTGGGPKRG